MCSRAGLDAFIKGKTLLPMPGYEPRFLGQPAHSLVIIQTTLSRLPFIMNQRIKTTLLSLPFTYHLLIRGVITLYSVVKNTDALESLSDSRLQAAFKMYAFNFRRSVVTQLVWSVCMVRIAISHCTLTLNGSSRSVELFSLQRKFNWKRISKRTN